MDEEQANKGLAVDFSQIFLNGFSNFPVNDIEKINEFVKHLSVHGFENLPGRNKPSDNVPTDDHEFIEKVKYAQDNNLHHYHIGIPHFDQSGEHGDWTSEYILHYMHLDSSIKIVDMGSHPPFSLPAEEYLK